jgi:hypothetical protein
MIITFGFMAGLRLLYENEAAAMHASNPEFSLFNFDDIFMTFQKFHMRIYFSAFLVKLSS